jgi:hypothetical protein
LWQTPSGVKGKYQVQVAIDTGPFEARQEDAWHAF